MDEITIETQKEVWVNKKCVATVTWEEQLKPRKYRADYDLCLRLREADPDHPWENMEAVTKYWQCMTAFALLGDVDYYYDVEIDKTGTVPAVLVGRKRIGHLMPARPRKPQHIRVGDSEEDVLEIPGSAIGPTVNRL